MCTCVTWKLEFKARIDAVVELTEFQLQDEKARRMSPLL